MLTLTLSMALAAAQPAVLPAAWFPGLAPCGPEDEVLAGYPLLAKNLGRYDGTMLIGLVTWVGVRRGNIGTFGGFGEGGYHLRPVQILRGPAPARFLRLSFSHFYIDDGQGSGHLPERGELQLYAATADGKQHIAGPLLCLPELPTPAG